MLVERSRELEPPLPSELPTRTKHAGLAVLGREEATAEEVLVQADLAMYQAKEAGRDRACAYSPEAGERARMQAGLSWTTRIRRALEEILT